MADAKLEPVEASLFEGLFKRALQPTGSFAAALKDVGFDPAHLKPRYSLKVWVDAIEVARRYTVPALTRSEGLHELGRRFSDGFFDTLIGKIIGAAFPVMGPDMMIKVSPRNVKAGRTDLEVTPVKEAEKRWRVAFKDAAPLPEFAAGLVEGAGRRTGVEMKVVVDARRPDGYDLLVTW